MNDANPNRQIEEYLKVNIFLVYYYFSELLRVIETVDKAQVTFNESSLLDVLLGFNKNINFLLDLKIVGEAIPKMYRSIDIESYLKTSSGILTLCSDNGIRTKLMKLRFELKKTAQDFSVLYSSPQNLIEGCKITTSEIIQGLERLEDDHNKLTDSLEKYLKTGKNLLKTPRKRKEKDPDVLSPQQNILYKEARKRELNYLDLWHLIWENNTTKVPSEKKEKITKAIEKHRKWISSEKKEMAYCENPEKIIKNMMKPTFSKTKTDFKKQHPNFFKEIEKNLP